MSWGIVAGTVREGRGEIFLKQSLKRHSGASEKTVHGGGGHWISPLCASVLKFEHESFYT